MKFLIGFVGPVGSGKTHIARIFARKLTAVHVRTDDIRIALRRQGKSYGAAPALARRKRDEVLAAGRSVVMDFDAIRPVRRAELQRSAKKFGARVFIIQVVTPERLILTRFHRHRYTRRDFFKNAAEAARVYFMRRKLHARALTPQIRKIIKRMKGL